MLLDPVVLVVLSFLPGIRLVLCPSCNVTDFMF